LQLMLVIANEVLQGIGFRNRIDQSVLWEEKQCDVTPGNLASALILTMFFDKRPPLWRVDEWYAAMHADTRALFGAEASWDKLNDDALGRMLDKLYKAGLGNLYMQICAQAIAKYDIAYKRIHSDTTTIAFYGEYETDSPIEDKNTEAVRIVPGYNKDHRPECKQVVVGKMVTEQGIPLGMATMNGNTPDVKWNNAALDMMSEIQSKGLQQGVYVADAKLMTQDLFARMTDPGRPIRFVSRVPASFANKLERRVLDMAYAQKGWNALGQLGGGKRASFYHGQSFELQVHDKVVRVLAVRSSVGSERWEHKLEKHRLELEEAIAQVSAKQFACQADAQKEYERFLKSVRKNPYVTSVCYPCQQREKRPVGRPSVKAPKPSVIAESWSVEIANVGLDPLRAKALQQQEESFVLITNCSELDEKQILCAYKEQQVVEIDFRYLKDPSVGSAILLKTPQRIEALLMLMHVALLVSSLLQYRLRKGRKAWAKPLPKIGWNGAMMMEAPTAYYLEYKVSGSFFRAVRGSPGEYDLLLRHRSDLDIILEMMDMSVLDMMEALQ
jgi:transposase